jgi:hypothetical protein
LTGFGLPKKIKKKLITVHKEMENQKVNTKDRAAFKIVNNGQAAFMIPITNTAVRSDANGAGAVRNSSGELNEK